MVEAPVPGSDRARSRPSLDGLVLGAAGFLPLVVGAAVAWAGGGALRAHSLALTLTWAGALLAFLAGVRRGLSFDEPGGAHLAELAAMFWLFVLAAAGLMVPAALARCALLLAGFASLAVLDAAAARRGEAPRYFALFRPAQSALAILALVALLVLALR